MATVCGQGSSQDNSTLSSAQRTCRPASSRKRPLGDQCSEVHCLLTIVCSSTTPRLLLLGSFML
jgi:hypothetical protein